MTKIKTNEIPGRAKHLFIKLYCEKKGGETQENIYDAAQSWLSLSLKKKQHFYETVSTKSAIKKAQLIIQTEPYLRAKFPSIARKNNQNETESLEQPNTDEYSEVAATDNIHDETVMECDSYNYSFAADTNGDDTLPEASAQDIESHTTLLPVESFLQEKNDGCDSHPDRNDTQLLDIFAKDTRLHEETEENVLYQAHNETQTCEEEKQQNSHMNIIDIDEETLSATEDFMNEDTDKTLKEPIVPVAKSGKELFELLNSRNRSNKTYESLPAKEKGFYGRAIRTIKREYVQKYREYLESLTSRQLFDYYRKVFF